MIVSVEECIAGDEIKFTNPSAGYSHQVAVSKEAGLVVGQIYVVSKIEVGDYHTDVWLESRRGPIGPFNSVQFRLVE